MRDYIVRRVLLIIPTVIVVSMMVFAMVRFMPGDTITALFQDQAYFDTVQKLRHELGLDRPIHEQYLSWVWGLVRGDFGASFATKRTALQELQQRLPSYPRTRRHGYTYKAHHCSSRRNLFGNEAGYLY